jgi:SAM-dependent methyltransferase
MRLPISSTDKSGESSGSPEVRSFYDSKGWKEVHPGRLLDQALFGDRNIGDIQRDAQSRRTDRVRQAFGKLGGKMSLVECGCGGTPAAYLADMCSSYTAVDFSRTGIAVARNKIAATGVTRGFAAADVCRLPFADNSFDAAYSAHVLYHIPDAAAQARAFDEIMRVVRPGGVGVFILANPRPLAFPGRFLLRLIADTPWLAAPANRLRKKPPLPFQPMPLGWMRGRLAQYGTVQITSYAMASTWFKHHVSETGFVGRMLWGGIRRMERDYPALSARLGIYALITVNKAS